jgi:uncharacterized protein with GYD domain
MSLYLLLGKDDPSSSTTLLLAGGEAIDNLVQAVVDVGGKFYSLAVTAGEFTLVGLLDLPEGSAAVALALTQACMGRDITFTPAVAVQDWPSLIETAKKIKVLVGRRDGVTASGDAQAKDSAPHA